VLGVMSGTSLDGIDLVACHFHKTRDRWEYSIDSAETIEYPKTWKKKLREAVYYEPEELQTLNQEYTQYLGSIISEFIGKHQLSNLDAVCSHGHTILHQPHDGITLQIGNLPTIADYTQQKVVCDFRVQDVALGGQGAPLVPIGDQLLFSEYDYCLNLGGFANVSYQVNDYRIAYDICPVNIVLNVYAEMLGSSYDSHGIWASEGNVNIQLLDDLNKLTFYQQKPPKSLGLEWVQQNIIPKLIESDLTEKDILATFVEHIAMQIAKEFTKNSKVLVTGGGTYNRYLLERLKFYSDCELIIPKDSLIEYKEALIFGLLGILRLRNEVNCLSSVTGASRDHSSGEVFVV